MLKTSMTKEFIPRIADLLLIEQQKFWNIVTLFQGSRTMESQSCVILFTYQTSMPLRGTIQSGKNRAEVAVGHTILTIIHILLPRKQEYVEFGFDYFDK